MGSNCHQCLSLFGSVSRASFFCKDCSQALCFLCANEVMNCVVEEEEEYDYLCAHCCMDEKNSSFLFDYTICCFLNCTKDMQLITVKQNLVTKVFCGKHLIGWNDTLNCLQLAKQYWLMISTKALFFPKDVALYVATFIPLHYNYVLEIELDAKYFCENDRERCVGLKWLNDKQIACLLRRKGLV